ncbi:MAG: topology modulation protein [Defluviitaleaceae bacterium]|nr:topology modulation protein [Defluviitaleaceae bacterium]
MNHNYKRIAILGCSGSGKSTLSRELATITGLPLVHLDMEFWRPNWKQTPKDEWRDKQYELVAQEQWIIDGHYNGTMDIRFAEADLVIYLDIPRITCLTRAIRRNTKERPDLPDFLEEKFDKEFFVLCKYIWNHRKTSRPRVFELHKSHPNVKFFVINNKKELHKLLEEFSDTY